MGCYKESALPGLSAMVRVAIPARVAKARGVEALVGDESSELLLSPTMLVMTYRNQMKMRGLLKRGFVYLYFELWEGFRSLN